LNLKLARIDDRLIHGQVIHGWIPKLGTTLVAVADSRLAANPDEQTVARLAVPESVDVLFVAPGQLAAVLAADARPVAVLFRTPVEALEAVQGGFQPQVINLGNLHFEPGKLQLRKTFCCSAPELAALRALADTGIEIEYQPAPDLKRTTVDLAHLGA
jgi:mannose/fructose/N-acetylgalactosamine-specific phosphotransferase system component IIB